MAEDARSGLMNQPVGLVVKQVMRRLYLRFNMIRLMIRSSFIWVICLESEPCGANVPFLKPKVRGPLLALICPGVPHEA